VDTAGRLGTAGTTGGSSTESSSSDAAEGGGDGAEKRKQVDGGEEEEAPKTAGGKMEGAGTTTIAEMPDEILLKVLSLLFGMTLMRSAPQVCKRWRKLCPEQSPLPAAPTYPCAIFTKPMMSARLSAPSPY
jgi:hypothetical protein